MINRAVKNSKGAGATVRSGVRAPSAGRFLRLFNENDIILGIFRLKFQLQKYSDDN